MSAPSIYTWHATAYRLRRGDRRFEQMILARVALWTPSHSTDADDRTCEATRAP